MFRNIKKTKLVLIFLSGFAGMRDVEKTSSSSRLNNHICFSSEPSSSAMILPQIEENRSEMKDPKVRSLKRKHNGDSITLDRQVSTILKSFYAITYYFILRVIIFVAFRMEYLDIILLLWFTIWACQKLLPKWQLLKSSCDFNKTLFLARYVPKEDVPHIHEALQRGYGNLKFHLFYIIFHPRFLLISISEVP